MYRPKKTSVVRKKKIEIAAAKDASRCDGIRDQYDLIAKFAGFKDARFFANTCRSIYHGTKSFLHLQLAHYVVVEPNEDKVIAMLTADPQLVNVELKEVFDNSRRKLINNTILQLAYGAGDYEMCLAIKPFFIQAYGREKAAMEAIKAQINAKFAEDHEADKQAGADFAALLEPVIEAINKETFNLGIKETFNLGIKNHKFLLNAATILAIETFREEFAKSQPKDIEKGMHFRDKTLLETYNAFIQAKQQWDSNYLRKKLLFGDGILSCVQSSVPANDAQRFSQGLFYLQSHWNEKLVRSFDARVSKEHFYKYLSSSGCFDFAGSCVDIDGCGETCNQNRESECQNSLSKLMLNKSIKRAELTQDFEPRLKPQCCAIS